jgi:hypothetical protein
METPRSPETIYGMVRIYRTDGTEIGIAYPRNAPPKLKELQEIVGGYIEVFFRDGDSVFVANEAGLIIGLPPNPFFNGIVGNVIKLTGFGNDYI